MDSPQKQPYGERYPVPIGFRGLLEALAREVLRAQPTDVYAFSSLFFSTLDTMRQDQPHANPLTDGDVAYAAFKHQLLEAGQRDGLIGRDSPAWRFLGLPSAPDAQPQAPSPLADENRNLLKNQPSPSLPAAPPQVPSSFTLLFSCTSASLPFYSSISASCESDGGDACLLPHFLLSRSHAREREETVMSQVLQSPLKLDKPSSLQLSATAPTPEERSPYTPGHQCLSSSFLIPRCRLARPAIQPYSSNGEKKRE